GKGVNPAGMYWGMPFALCVPVEQPYSGGKIKLSYVLRERWEDPAMVQRAGYHRFVAERKGIYALDGTPIEKGTITQDDSSHTPVKPSTRPGFPVYTTRYDN